MTTRDWYALAAYFPAEGSMRPEPAPLPSIQHLRDAFLCASLEEGAPVTDIKTARTIMSAWKKEPYDGFVVVMPVRQVAAE